MGRGHWGEGRDGRGGKGLGQSEDVIGQGADGRGEMEEMERRWGRDREEMERRWREERRKERKSR